MADKTATVQPLCDPIPWIERLMRVNHSSSFTPEQRAICNAGLLGIKLKLEDVSRANKRAAVDAIMLRSEGADQRDM